MDFNWKKRINLLCSTVKNVHFKEIKHDERRNCEKNRNHPFQKFEYNCHLQISQKIRYFVMDKIYKTNANTLS